MTQSKFENTIRQLIQMYPNGYEDQFWLLKKNGSEYYAQYDARIKGKSMFESFVINDEFHLITFQQSWYKIPWLNRICF